MGRLEGRIALVTGAGGGIGRAIAVAMAAEGAIVEVTDIDLAAAEAVAAQIGASGGVAHGSQLDVTESAPVLAAFAAIKFAHGKLDILVNNAGLNVRADFRHMTDEDWVKIRSTNLDGVVRLSRDGFELLRESGRLFWEPDSWRIGAGCNVRKGEKLMKNICCLALALLVLAPLSLHAKKPIKHAKAKGKPKVVASAIPLAASASEEGLLDWSQVPFNDFSSHGVLLRQPQGLAAWRLRSSFVMAANQPGASSEG